MTQAPGPRTTVHLVRHGEVHNPTKVLYGRLPGFGLSAAGVAGAQAVARHLAGHDVAAVLASPLQRARETAAPIAAAHGLEVGTDPRLIESSNVFEGRTVEFGPRAFRDPALWKYLWDPVTPSWGEPYTDIAARVLTAVHEARREHTGREVVLVSHQLPVWTARRALEGRRLWHRPDRRQCGLASVTSVTYAGEHLSHITYTEPSGPGGGKPGTVGA